MFRYFLSALLFFSYSIKAQKPLIDTSTFRIWTSVEKPLISSDGKYVSYKINNQPLGSSTTVLQSVDGQFKKEFVNIDAPQFVYGSKFYLYSRERKKSFIFRIGDGITDSISTSKPIQFIKCPKGDFLVYYDNEGLVLQDCKLDRKKIYSNAVSHLVSDDGNWLALVNINRNSPGLRYIDLINLKTFAGKSIWDGKNPERIIFDKSNTQLAFLMESPTKGAGRKTIGYYKWGMKNAVSLEQVDSLCNKTENLISGYDNWKFSGDGKQLFFKLMPKMINLEEQKGVKVDIWNYLDPFLQSAQLKRVNIKNGYLNAINLNSGKIIRLTGEDERTLGIAFNKNLGDILIVDSTSGDVNEAYWNPLVKKIIYLVFARTGQRIELIRSINGILCQDFQLSPSGKYITYFDPSEMNYYTYNVESGAYNSITRGIDVNWMSYLSQGDMNKNKAPIGIACWMDGDRAVLINSRYDIWKVDPEGINGPINLTRKGTKNTVYCLGFNIKSDEYLRGNEVLIKSFNVDTKNCGFYSLDLRNTGTLKKLSEGPFAYQMKGVYPYNCLNESIDCAKAINAKAYLVCRQDASNSPNYFFTSDFISFKRISSVFPEKSYNWITSELHRVELPNGRISHGVLYKPENFDPTKRYPVLFYFYQLISQELNEYKPAQANGGANFSIPYFVSNGYLVYTPDIVFDSRLGESALICVESAARYLTEQPWVDSIKMGISGHSLGGYEANFIATHSKMFAAAVSGAGVSDLISAYGSVWGSSGLAKSSLVEMLTYKMEVTPWEDLKKYIESSPIVTADRVIAPILIMHNSGDASVEFSQGVAFYNALRRLGKKVWLLQYDGQNHVNSDSTTMLDITIRIKQFFDHYLKGNPMPRWMKVGVKADWKGIDNGLQLIK